ncbi:MAG: universal stress protein [Actinomycetota bacterium]|nr:MAG: universal stress protein [Actinomycetota bacterium]HSQ27020.1 universal stress protein [Anaerolineales bacterium]
MFKRILVAVDGSEHATKAAQLAGDICRSMGSNLFVVTIFDPIPHYLGEPIIQEVLSKRINLAQGVLDDALEQIGKIPGDLETEMLEGPAAEAILTLVETRNIDLVIMGSRGLGRLKGLVLGSQSQKVVQHASCPVLLVR